MNATELAVVVGGVAGRLAPGAGAGLDEVDGVQQVRGPTSVRTGSSGLPACRAGATDLFC